MSDLRQLSGRRGAREFLISTFQIAKGLLQVALVLGTLGGTVIGLLVFNEVAKLPDMSFLKNYKPVDSVTIYDKNDKVIESIDQGIPRTVLPFKSVPPVVRYAVMAAEDKHFYEHHGVSPQGIMRAMIANLKSLHMKEGGSTITQQLAKNLFFLDVKRTGIIKLAEMVAAYQIENNFSKEEIFALYLTEIYFGNGARGIQQAAQTYFGVDASNLNISQAAFLAGIIRSPSYLGSAKHRQDGLDRQKQVLRAMLENGYITTDEELQAEAIPLNFKAIEPPRKALPYQKFPYFISYVLETVRKRFDERTIGLNGLKIYTTLDPVAQEIGEAVLAQEIRRAPLGIDEEALVSLAVKDGSVRALVGGAHNFWDNQWNCATTPHTAGSSLKPFVYLSSFIAGVNTPESTVLDAPYEMLDNGKKWTPKNFDGKYLGLITVRDALTQSRNMCTIRVTEQIGINNVVTTMKTAGITSPLTNTLSIALGSSAVTPIELASAYGTIARGGLATPPWTIRKVEDSRGKLLYFYVPVICRVFPQEQVTWVIDVLQDVVQRGTGTLARFGTQPVAGKTGTADKAKDIWFVGFTPDMVTCVWGGGDEKGPSAGRNVTGGTVMARVFRSFNESYYRRVPTAKGELLASRYNDINTYHEPVKPISHSHDVPYVDTQSPTPVQMPTRSTEARRAEVVRARKGVTEYNWSER